jgi:hypothetical protein
VRTHDRRLEARPVSPIRSLSDKLVLYFLSILVNGMLAGTIYALIALAFVVI